MHEPAKITKARVPVTAVDRVRVQKGFRIDYEDDEVEVYDNTGKIVYSGMLDYTDYKYENAKWNDKDKNYDLPNGYKMVGLTKH